MEWRDKLSQEPLERSSGEDSKRNRYRREAGDNSMKSPLGTSRQYSNSDGSEESSPFRGSQVRRRRRISEMDNNKISSNRSRFSNDAPQLSDRQYGAEYASNLAENRSQRSFYKEQYSQVREAKRQIYAEGRVRVSGGGYGEGFSRGNNYNNSKNRARVSRQGASGRSPAPSRGARSMRKSELQPPVYDQDPIDISEEIRLNKFLSNAGVCSRREADELIKVGAVLVNGAPVTELGTKITARDLVEVNGREVRPEQKVYLLLNKPRNCVTTTDDPQERLTVTHLVRKACKERIYPVGRLDRNTTGVLLLTNDGDLAAQLVHPSHKKKKIYHVWLDREVAAEDMQKLADGVELEDGEMHADAISYVTEDDLSQVGIEIHSGRNRIVRRLFEHLGYHVKKLDRVYFAGLTKKNLGRGKWRYLTQDEVNNLKSGAFE
ncbi:pseudouridine synthase [Porphyromonas somerae]|uniref:pseudouridine synthase n=1 Tax=Porphyromonas somerae TaxID=322095 RepID=UPI000372A7BC|nr:pseudouridine synthase [Porphyromonas somerae]